MITLADVAFYHRSIGANFGVYALSLVLAVLVAAPAARRSSRALVALIAAAGAALLFLEHPTVTMACLFVLALGVAVLSPRAPASDDVWPWAQRLTMAMLRGLIGPLKDLRRLHAHRLRQRRSGMGLSRFSVLLLPLAGGLVFFALFAAANPLIAVLLEAIRLPRLDLARSIFWLLTGVAAWGVLRPRGLRRTIALPDGRGDLKVFGVTPTSLFLSLVVFNALFALQNGLDLAFLWSHAPLPAGVTLAEYAHRGAYLLIATAILAGAFVLIALRPGSTTAASPAVRRMVVLFVAQNLLLVASSAVRTLDYVEAYGLTQLRLAALAWMVLVAVGLILICVRLLQDRSSGWLINTNAAATVLVLVIASLADLGAVAATWNSRNAREVAGHGPRLDLCYLEALGPAALVPLAELEGRSLPAPQAETITSARIQVLTDLDHRQMDWRTWSWRNARRLNAARALIAHHAPPPPWPTRYCDGRPYGEENMSPPPGALTDAAQPGT
ncbi:DUF4153 domain-containing protein [Caulobacter sp. RHG1]|uniref:DUF4153 domain-containing protein n=1 Tax=Caulobacter sp. (strain RHG1) TaxID=2545762 RepID=UPI0015556EFD|nr:DUF4173 domain-containing protein [Caulobacter sp. RHG1]NQE61371.1 hypothetical protein [Caulobacter sp. RHG1]